MNDQRIEFRKYLYEEARAKSNASVADILRHVHEFMDSPAFPKAFETWKNTARHKTNPSNWPTKSFKQIYGER